MKYSALRPLALASLAGNVVLIVTGGAVRLTGSGLGCPTWPKCTDASVTTTKAMGVHGVIEFGNRSLSTVLGVLALACMLAAALELPRRGPRRWLPDAWRERRRGAAPFWLSLGTLAGVLAQGVVGGITVLTGLNPWVVGLHFVATIAVIAVGYALWRRTGEGAGVVRRLVPAAVRQLALVLTAVSAAVIAVGVMVTGSGPHSGDENTGRNGFDPVTVTQAHADLVFLLLGLTVALWFALRATGGPTRATVILLAVELSQGLIGFVQYFTHLPIVLVGLHMLGSGLVWLATLAVLWSLRERAAVTPAAEPAPRQEPAVVA